VIVSTLITNTEEVSLRVRDTGIGMSETEIAAALAPFRNLATSTRFGSGAANLGLPLAKAMAEANRARFDISSKPNSGTLTEVTFSKASVTTG
jgi:signal transduction histidine kinase